MSKFVIVGAGATGRAVMKQLVAAGHSVAVVSRSGAKDLPAGAESVVGDAGNAEFLTKVCEGAVAVFNCANPPYDRWMTDWPPIADALLRAASASGATLATLSNLYAYGQPTGPMKPGDPLPSTLPKAQVRAKMWHDAKAWHDAGLLRAVEVRASDFIGKGSQSFFERATPALRQGKAAMMISPVDITHSWTYVDDVARTLIAAATDPTAAGRPWHALTNPPKTIREVLNDFAREGGLDTPKVRVLPMWALKTMGLFSPLMRELPKVAYQFASPFIIDDTETRVHFNLEPTPWVEVIAATWHS